MLVDARQESVSEVEIRLEEQHCHRFESHVHEHAVRLEFSVVLVISLLEVDYGGKYLDHIFHAGSLRRLSLGSSVGCLRWLWFEMWTDQECLQHARQVFKVSLGRLRIDPRKV